MTIEIFGGAAGGSGQLPTYTWAGKPASYATGQPVFMSDVGPKGSHWYYDGTLWKPLGGECLLASLDATSASIGNSETIVFQYQMPTGLWQNGYVLHFAMSMSKSGTTDTGALRARIGTAGTTADTQIFNVNVLAAANQQFSGVADIRLESATSVQQMPNTAGIGLGAANAAVASPVTISSAVANALYFNASLSSGGTTNTVAILHAELFLIGKAN
jgi:hypothetical protein